tara:strand:+ start:7665 stop:9701 length:2037 start_codon:yes stop_codon:yes gene_type:complete
MENNIYSVRKLVLKNLFWLGFIFLFFVLLWVYYYMTATRIYEAKSLIQFEQKTMTNQITDSVQPFFFGSSQIEEQGKIYKSVKNLSKLVSKLKLDILVNHDFVDHKNSEIYDDVEIIANLNNSEKLNLNIILQEDGYKLNDIGDGSTYGYNTSHDFDDFKISISRNLESVYQNAEIRLTKISIIDSVQRLNRILKVNPFLIQMAFDATLMEVIFSGPDVNLSKKIINNLNQIYLEDSVYQNATQARASITFLDDRVMEIQSLLEISENRLNLFQQENLFVQQDDEVKKLFERLAKIETQIDEVELLELEYKNKFTVDSDIFTNLLDQKNYLKNSKEVVLNEVSNLPKIQQEYLNLLRDVELNVRVLEDLINKKLEFSILEASTLSDVVIIDDAFNNGKVSPIASTTLIIYLFMASIVSAGFLILRALFSPMRFPSELNEASDEIKLLGVIPNTDLSDKANSVATNTLLTNLELLVAAEKTNSFMVCGPLSGVGKSTVARSISTNLQKIKKKVALVDCDYHRGDLHKDFNVKRPSIDSLSKSRFDIERFRINENLIFIPRPRNSSDYAITHFESEDFASMINILKENVDYVVFDTPPLLSLSDALRLLRFVDKIILTGRHNQTKMRDIKECVTQLTAVTSKEIYGVYNCYEKSKLNYGYYDYYGYKYYSSDYYYEKDEN